MNMAVVPPLNNFMGPEGDTVMTVSAGNVIPSKNNIPAFCRHRVDTSHFLIFTTRVGLKTKTKRGEIAFFRPVATESGNIIFWRV